MWIKFLFSLFLLVALSACGSDRAGKVEDNKTNAGTTGNSGVLGVVERDSDGDGIIDVDEINLYGTNPDSNDTDGDGLTDGDELNIYETNATSADTDNDGLLDGEEIHLYDTNVTNPDSDDDGLNDGDEIHRYDTNATNPDTDFDGLTDGSEVTIHETNASNPDTDGDSLSDGDELTLYFTNPLKVDTDGDTLTDGEEINTYETNATNVDSDGDGLSDGKEINIYDSNASNPDTDSDGLNDGLEVNTYMTEILNPDTDNDGLSDGEEINIYETNATNIDTDADGLEDGAEVHNTTESTNPLKQDSDNDGLLDAFEVERSDLNASNPDTDGDCLLDSYEVNYYHTDANNSDTDSDGVDDGIEVYSYIAGEVNSTCLSTPESLMVSHNLHPAMDNIPTPDKINALDRSNDSDGDGQANVTELSCDIGDPLDGTKVCLFLTDTADGRLLSEYGYAYMPGGFDVDGDSVPEGGFWLSTYQARASDVDVPVSDIVAMMSNGYNQFIIDNFELVNGKGAVTGYTHEILDTTDLQVPKVLFKKSEVENRARLTETTPYSIIATLKNYKLTNSEGEALDMPLHLMNEKQYAQVRMLLDADLANGGDGKTIRNGLLANDTNVPLVVYSIKIEEFGRNFKEYTSTIVQLLDNTNVNEVFTLDDIKDWWGVNKSIIVRNLDGNGKQDGANSRINVGFSAGVRKDHYAVCVMGKDQLDLTQGTAGINEDSIGTTNGIGFRAASGYLK